MLIQPKSIICAALASIGIACAVGAITPARAADYPTSFSRFHECEDCEHFADRDVRWRHRHAYRWRRGYADYDVGYAASGPAIVIERPPVVERRVVVERPIIERRVVVERPIIERRVLVERPAVVERRVFVETTPPPVAIVPGFPCCY